MQIRGRIHNGVVVLDGDVSLPEGTIVTVFCPASPPTAPPDSRCRVQLPLVPSDRPGTLHLTAERHRGTSGRRRSFRMTPDLFDLWIDNAFSPVVSLHLSVSIRAIRG